MCTTLGSITSLIKTDTEFLIQYDTGERAKLNILNSHVFRYYMSPTDNFNDYPVPDYTGTAKINVKNTTDYDPTPFKYSILKETEQHYIIDTHEISIIFDKKRGTLTVHDLRTNRDVLLETQALQYNDTAVTQTLHQHEDEYFFGGGMQNGRFSHKGTKIIVTITNMWGDGAVTSPSPLYWSSKGYSVLRNTWRSGVYDFGSKESNIVQTTHYERDFDAFFFISPNVKDILKDYYELTGQPIFMPEFAFYEAHIKAFNHEYWVMVDDDTPNAILFEDGFFYICCQSQDLDDTEGSLGSLNGENNNYQFSARAMIDRYKKHDMPLGWVFPNAYGYGYGKTNTLIGDIENLHQFAKYAREKGVEVALVLDPNLEPSDPKHPKKGDRDLEKEVRATGIVALDCGDWPMAPSGLTFVENATNIFLKEAHQSARPVITMVNGWAGTQRYAGIHTGHQTGGQWEYIRFHIPTFIGAGLSGIPIVGSDMDGIYGGGDNEVNIRDYQWKTFTPLQLNRDGWGNTQKSPFSFDDETTLINRAYLKLKSMFLSYNYTLGHDSIDGLPMIRAMFIEFPEDSCGYTKDSQYQYMWGPYILVAPVYKEQNNKAGEWVRHGIYLPDPNQVWVDLLTGEKYQGGKIWNDLKTPLWKIPIFVKDGAIIPMVNANNNPNEIERDKRIFNIYPNGETNFKVYEDDGKTSDYLKGHHASTEITVIGPNSNGHGDLFIHVHKTEGSYKNIVKERSTLFRIMASEDIQHIKATINDETVHIPKVESEEELLVKENAYYFNQEYVVNPYLKDLGGDLLKQKCLFIKIQKADVTESDIHIKIKGFVNKTEIKGSNNDLNTNLHAPSRFSVLDEDITPTSICLRWKPENNVYYEIERDGTLFTNIESTEFTFEEFRFCSEYNFRIRSANEEGVSNWSDYIVVCTKYSHIVQNVSVTCNAACEPSQEVCNLTDEQSGTFWHTLWWMPACVDSSEGKVLKLTFDLGKLYSINKMEYTPRSDAGNGTILEFQYRFSQGNEEWSPMSSVIHWEEDNTTKTILFQGQKMRFLELNVLEAVRGFGSGRRVTFYKKEDLSDYNMFKDYVLL